MAPMKAIQIFRPGRHTDSGGHTLSFSAADLEAMAQVYDPAIHQAPLVVGHPRHDAPAYGWVAGLSYAEDGGTLDALPEQVDPQFGELVRAGRLKYVSASFYMPDAPQNPRPGAYYLRHVGFLGAQPPAIKGLRPAEFADDLSGVVTVEFSEPWAWRVIASLFRRLRERLIASDGPEVADTAIPEYDLQTLEDAAREEAEDSTAKELDMPPTNPSAAFAEREQALSLQAQDLAAQKAQLDAREAALAAQEAERRHAECAAFAESLVAQGRLLPRDQAPLAALLADLPDTPTASFAEGAEGLPRSPGAYLRDLLARAPVQIDYHERTAPDGTPATLAEFAAPDGYQIDPQYLPIHRRALALRAEHPTLTYDAALSAALKEPRP